MSKATELRKKIETERNGVSQERLVGTNERLRADHISMMELLNKTVNSNMQLESELSNLRKMLGNEKSTLSLDEANAEIKMLKQNVSDLQNVVDSLKNEKQSIQINCDEQIKVYLTLFLNAIVF